MKSQNRYKTNRLINTVIILNNYFSNFQTSLIFSVKIKQGGK